MLPFTSPLQLCEPASRREVLRLGGALLPVGLTLPTLLARRASASGAKPIRARAKSCLIIFMEGGASHIDLWDMKPNAPSQIRGEFKPIATQTPGITVCEHLPMLAKHWHKLAQVCSVTHGIRVRCVSGDRGPAIADDDRQRMSGSGHTRHHR